MQTTDGRTDGREDVNFVKNAEIKHEDKTEKRSGEAQSHFMLLTFKENFSKRQQL